MPTPDPNTREGQVRIASGAERLANDLDKKGMSGQASYLRAWAGEIRNALNGPGPVSAPSSDGGVAQSARDLLAEIQGITYAAGVGIDAYLGTQQVGTWWDRNKTLVIAGAGGAVLLWIVYGFSKSWLQGKVIGRSLQSVFGTQKTLGG